MEKKILYLECESGISGDMTVAALLDLGADQAVLEQALDSLLVTGFQTVVRQVKKAGLLMCDFDVVLDKEHENHDHDMEYLHGHNHEHGHHHGKEHLHEKVESHTQKEHQHRGLSDILHIIEHAKLTANAKKNSQKDF